MPGERELLGPKGPARKETELLFTVVEEAPYSVTLATNAGYWYRVNIPLQKGVSKQPEVMVVVNKKLGLVGPKPSPKLRHELVKAGMRILSARQPTQVREQVVSPEKQVPGQSTRPKQRDLPEM